MYPIEIVQPMKEQLTDYGFKELLNSSDVENMLLLQGVVLVVINSVCGCSAGSCRPGVLQALVKSNKKPNYLYTSFAGYDVEAVKKLREHLLPYPPSSPSIALFQDGKLVYFIERYQIESSNAEIIAQLLNAAFEIYC
ncbi:MAG: BrxA/BrxB family bacilliredoxin [Chitinophagaceae bacterium]